MAKSKEYQNRDGELNTLVAVRSQRHHNIRKIYAQIDDILQKLYSWKLSEYSDKISFEASYPPNCAVLNPNRVREIPGNDATKMTKEMEEFNIDLCDHVIEIYEGWREKLIKDYNSLLNYQGDGES
jgi:hypothetical protein